MRSYVLVPGAGGVATWFFSRLARLLEKAGNEAIAVDLPGDDETAGLTEYADLVVQAVGGRREVVLLAQSLGGFTAPLVANRTRLDAVVFVNAMIPEPGERAADWWGNTGWSQARTKAATRHGYPPEFDLQTYFLHDVDPLVAQEGAPYQRNEADAAFASVCAFETWPDITIRAVTGEEDRFFPLEFQQQLVRDRLGIEADVLPGGHLLALSQPAALARYLLAI
jgi:surfactin synthase thioesterase subunit